MNNSIIKEGMEAFYRDKRKYINPYKPGSDEYNDFERGWMQALKRSSSEAYTGKT